VYPFDELLPEGLVEAVLCSLRATVGPVVRQWLAN
jgi:hypothetical protein